MKNLFHSFVVPVSIFVLDQSLKCIVRFSNSYLLNASWLGFFSSSRTLNFILVGLLSIIVLFWFKTHHSLSLGLIVAGGLSNGIDRFVYGGVVDYVFVKSFAFNIADAAIWIGCVLALIHHVRVNHPLKRLEH